MRDTVSDQPVSTPPETRRDVVAPTHSPALAEALEVAQERLAQTGAGESELDDLFARAIAALDRLYAQHGPEEAARILGAMLTGEADADALDELQPETEPLPLGARVQVADIVELTGLFGRSGKTGNVIHVSGGQDGPYEYIVRLDREPDSPAELGDALFGLYRAELKEL